MIFEPWQPKTLYCDVIGTAAAILGAAAVGAAATAYSANKASEAQTNSANTAAQIQAETAKRVLDQSQSQFNTTQSNLAPFRDIGATAAGDLTSRLGELTSPIKMDQATLEQTPGYQFNLYQGEKAVQNSAAARGLGTSGAALKGAATFATGLADSTYQNQFANAVTNQTNAYNRLKGLIDTGTTASVGTGALGQAASQTQATALGTAATGASNAAIGAGNAQAAGINATGAAFSGAANNIGGYMAYKGLYGNDNAPLTNIPQPGMPNAMGYA